MNNSYIPAAANITRFVPFLLALLKSSSEKKEAAELHSWKLLTNYPQYLNRVYCYTLQPGMVKFLKYTKKMQNINGIS
jgi:hypothetical protein